jgi:ribonuclease HII
VRCQLAPRIQAAAVAWGVGATAAAQIDQLGIAAATRLAMSQAIAALAQRPDYLLLDWVRLPQVNIAQESFIKADRDIVAVAAASILAKVYRDELMNQLHIVYPHYGFAQHKGYGTVAHLATLEQHGPCVEHRYTFAPMAGQLALFTQNCTDQPRDLPDFTDKTQKNLGNQRGRPLGPGCFLSSLSGKST